MRSMDKKHPLTKDEREFWDKAFLVAEFKGRRWSPAGAAHVAREFADAALAERRRAYAGEQS